MSVGAWFATVVLTVFAWVCWTNLAGHTMQRNSAWFQYASTGRRFAAAMICGAVLTAVVLGVVLGVTGGW